MTHDVIRREELIAKFAVLRPRAAWVLDDLITELLPERLAGVTPLQMLILRNLRDGPMSMSALAKLLGMGNNSMSQIANRIAEMNLVTRSSNPSDRRVVLLGLSDEGRQLLEGYWDHHREVLAEVLADVSDRDLGIVLKAFQKIIDSAEERATSV